MQHAGMQENTRPLGFEIVERNLRDMFRAIAHDKPAADIRELPGVSIASSGAAFQMFNAAFLNAPVTDQADLERRILMAQMVFRSRRMAWSLWVCEEWVPRQLRRGLSRICQRHRLQFTTEMPAMIAGQIHGREDASSLLEIAGVISGRHVADFCQVGAACFRVPPPWFEEIYRSADALQGPMRAWVGYLHGKPVSTVATLESDDAIGVYNLATVSPFRKQGLGEAMLRHAVRAANSAKPVVLQSTPLGMRLYERLGLQSVGRILVFPSI